MSKIYQEQENLGNIEILEIIKRFSPIAWCHIILDGFYQFKDVAEAIDLEQMITNLVFDFDKASKATTKNYEKANSNDAIKKQRKSRVKAQTQRSLNANVRVQIDVRIFEGRARFKSRHSEPSPCKYKKVSKIGL